MENNMNETTNNIEKVTSEPFLRYFSVYHNNMRDAQVFYGNCDDEDYENDDEYDDENVDHEDSEWYDYEADPCFGNLFARDEEDAKEITAEVTGIHKSNFSAYEYFLTAEGKQKNSKISARALFSSFIHGIEVSVPGNKSVFIYMDGETPKLAINTGNTTDDITISF